MQYSHLRRRSLYMKLAAIICIIGTAGLLFLSNTAAVPKASGTPRKDSLRRIPTPPHLMPQKHKTALRKSPSVPKKSPPVIAEEDRLIAISAPVRSITIKKSLNKMYVYFADTFKVFRVSLGANPVGHKTRQGDNRTPEGRYHISFKNPNSRGYKSLKISYPNETDLSYARKIGVNPGGDIFIHGLWWPQQNPATHWKDNWTWGCVALNNQEIDELYAYTEVNTEILILP